MTTYFRYQIGQYSLEEMQNYTSEDGGDEMEAEGGICACDSVTGLLRNTVYGPAKDAEVVVLKGQQVCEIYDGTRIYPTAVVARHSYSEWQAKVADGSAYEYEYEA
jgi:hypothetical protein